MQPAEGRKTEKKRVETKKYFVYIGKGELNEKGVKEVGRETKAMPISSLHVEYFVLVLQVYIYFDISYNSFL